MAFVRRGDQYGSRLVVPALVAGLVLVLSAVTLQSSLSAFQREHRDSAQRGAAGAAGGITSGGGNSSGAARSGGSDAAASPAVTGAVADTPWAARNNYNFSLSRQHMLRGLVSHGGDGARARRALAKLASGQPSRVAFMGEWSCMPKPKSSPALYKAARWCWSCWQDAQRAPGCAHF